MNPWNHLNINDAPESFQFVVVTDRTGGLRPGVFASAVPKINLLQPEFVMSVGDLITGYTEDENQIDREWDEFDGLVDQLNMPFFLCTWQSRLHQRCHGPKMERAFGQRFLPFCLQRCTFPMPQHRRTQTWSRTGFIDDPQYDYIEKTLAENQEVKWTLIFMHQPLWDQEDPGRWPDVEKLLAKPKTYGICRTPTPLREIRKKQQ